MGKGITFKYFKISIVIPIIISLIFLYIAYRSYVISRESKEIAQKALNISRESKEIAQKALNFKFSELKPHIILKPVKFKETGHYLKVSGDDKEVFIKFQYTIENSGKTVAKNISFPTAPIKVGKGVFLYVKLPPVITLAPGEKEESCGIIRCEGSKDAVADFIEELNAGHAGITSQFVLFYFNELEPSKKQKIVKKYKFSKYNAVILRSEREQL